MRTKLKTRGLSLAIASLLMTAAASGQDRDDSIDDGIDDIDIDTPEIGSDDAGIGNDDLDESERAETAEEIQEQIDEAARVVSLMQADPDVAQLLDRAQGVFIIPDYAQAALVVGGQGGEGIVLMRQSGAAEDQNGAADDQGVAADDQGAAADEWTSPAFYNFGGATFGAAAGVEIGAIAMLLMSEEAVQAFQTDETDFSIDASAGLTILDFAARAEASGGRGDVVVWSDTEGAFAGATIGINGIDRDDDEMEAYYGEGVDARQILSGTHPHERAQNLREALAG